MLQCQGTKSLGWKRQVALSGGGSSRGWNPRVQKGLSSNIEVQHSVVEVVPKVEIRVASAQQNHRGGSKGWNPWTCEEHSWPPPLSSSSCARAFPALEMAPPMQGDLLILPLVLVALPHTAQIRRPSSARTSCACTSGRCCSRLRVALCFAF